MDVRLSIEPVDAEMIDGQIVYMVVYFNRGSGSNEPRPVLRATEGDAVVVTVTNNAPKPHAFAVHGVPGASTGAIAPGATATLTFTAPQGGSYLYLDPTNAPVNRLLGLHGAFIVAPRNGLTLAGSATPFSAAAHTPALRQVFDAMGAHPRFPGEKWKPADPRREKIWLFNQIDPTLHARVEAGQTVNGATLGATFLPRYFTINGHSGFDLAHDDSCPEGYIGQPTLIRSMNAGFLTHSPHIHGNHVMELSETDAGGAVVVRDNILERDVWRLPPLERRDVLLPFERPPDAAVWPPRQEPFPMRYVMHCHTEMSQTAGGGSYPQGAVLHWEIKGPLPTGPLRPA